MLVKGDLKEQAFHSGYGSTLPIRRRSLALSPSTDSLDASASMADLSVFHPVCILAAILDNGSRRYITASGRAVSEFDVGHRDKNNAAKNNRYLDFVQKRGSISLVNDNHMNKLKETLVNMYFGLIINDWPQNLI